jgi:hypothetical protein
MSFIGSLEIIDVEGNSTIIRPALVDELAWQNVTKKTLTQLADMDIRDIATLAYEYSKRTGLTDKPMLEWAKDIDAIVPVGDFPKATTKAPTSD